MCSFPRVLVCIVVPRNAGCQHRQRSAGASGTGRIVFLFGPFPTPEPRRNLAMRGPLRLAFQRQQKLATPVVPRARRGHAVDRIANDYRLPRFGSGFEGVEMAWDDDNVVTLWS